SASEGRGESEGTVVGDSNMTDLRRVIREVKVVGVTREMAPRSAPGARRRAATGASRLRRPRAASGWPPARRLSPVGPGSGCAGPAGGRTGGGGEGGGPARRAAPPP